jgi:hypothetical protein
LTKVNCSTSFALAMQIGHLRHPNLPSYTPNALRADFTSRNQTLVRRGNSL